MLTYEIFLKNSTIKTNDIRLAHEYRDKGYIYCDRRVGFRGEK